MQALRSDGPWLVHEAGWDPERAGVYETIFTVGNGALGTRATLDEGSPGQRSGTFLAGVYDDHGSPVIDLVNAPDWTACTVTVNGTDLSVATARVLEHTRSLDLRRALLLRETTFEDDAGNRTRLETVRWASAADPRLCLQRITVTPLDHDARIEVTTRLDGERRNLDRIPVYPPGTVHDPEVAWEKWAWTNHLDETERLVLDDMVVLGVRTRSSGVDIGYASTTTAPGAERTARSRRGQVEEVHGALVPAGESLRLDRVVAVATSRRVQGVRTVVAEAAAAGRERGLDALLEDHVAVWEQRWRDADCEVVGDEEATLAVRFGIYHLLIAADGSDPSVNIGAKSLSGEGYRGHVFWDTEALMLPFFTFTQPATARALLGYRHHLLPGARALAAEGGHRGARFPWESADSGREECPRWTDDGSFRFWSRDEEVHVSADVAYGVLSYVAATGDEEFLAGPGLELLVETARFWVDRADHDEGGGTWSIRQVMGPDEFHSHVDDNAFTNLLVAWALHETADTWERLADERPREVATLAGALDVGAEEVATWRAVADGLVVHRRDDGVVEQFTGYFDREDLPITQWDENSMPEYPEGHHHFSLEDTMLIKQPDVLMAMHLLPDRFDADTKRANFAFYEARTLHKSSLSPAIHAVLGLEVGDPAMAMQYFRRSAFVDLHDNQGNTHMGMHIASAAGTWQIVVNGFAGVRVVGGRLSVTPRLPPRWDEVRFRLAWHGDRVAVAVRRDEVGLELESQDPGSHLEVLVAGDPVVLHPGRPVVCPVAP